MVPQVRWLPMESNPEVITKFMHAMGVEKGVKCVDVLGFDDDDILTPCHAVILCFPSYKKMDELMKPLYDKLVAEGAKVPEEVFFMKQKEQGKCGAFAIIHALVNNRDTINLGEGSLHKWMEKVKGADAEERAKLLIEDEQLAREYSECVRREEGDQQENLPTEHHFICYTNVNGTLYEIDSRMACPRACGETNKKTLMKDAGAVCKQLMGKIEDISFSALAIVPN